MTTTTGTSSNGSNTRSADLVAPDTSARLVTAIVGVVVALTFLFGFGNVVRHEVAQSEWTHRVRDRRCPVV